VWFQLKIEHCLRQEIDLLSDELEELGALSIMLTDKNDNPVLEPEPGTRPLWPEVTVDALFSEVIQAQFVRAHLNTTHPSLKCTLELLEDKNWERVWMDDFKPQRFGERLWICPSWTPPPDPNAVNLMLDPGLAFGTGTHATTALCLTWLEQASLKSKTLIDYGCGSGILSPLAALKLDAAQVQAVDIDPQALQATQNNAFTNNINSEQLRVSAPEALIEPSDFLIANILLAPLIQLSQRFYELLNTNGVLIVSGLLEEQAPLLIEAYQPQFDCTHQKNLDGWALLVFARKE